MRSTRILVKRAMDIVLSIFGLLLLMPLFLIISVLIVITMPGPILFKQERIGKDRRPFQIVKFRSMKVDYQAQMTHDLSKDNERATLTGRFLRRTKLDELPQLFNVLRGDMSIVGPRPYIKEQCMNLPDERFIMRPGMTGLGQVNGNQALDGKMRLQYDLWYIRHFTVLLDFRIIMKTFMVIIFGESCFERNFRLPEK